MSEEQLEANAEGEEQEAPQDVMFAKEDGLQSAAELGADPAGGPDETVFVLGGNQLIAAEGGVIERDLETGEETFVPQADFDADNEQRQAAIDASEARMRDILESRKAPAVISRRGDRPKRLVSRNGRIYDKRTGNPV